MILPSVTSVGAQLLLCVAVSSAFVSGQTESTRPVQPQAAANSQDSAQSQKKSSPVQLDARPTALMTTPTAVETSQETFDYAGQRQANDKEHKTGEVVVAPFPISNPALGSGIVVVGGYLFPVSKRDEISPTSMVGGGSLYTSNGSWLWAVGTKLYIMRDRFRITGAYGHARFQYDLYGIGNSAGNLGLSVPIDQGGEALLVESLIRVKSKLFLGPRYQWRSLNARLKEGNLLPALNIDPVELKSTTSAVGFHLQRDLRDNQFYSTTGTLADVVGDFFQGTLGSDFSYQSYTFAFNKYSSISPRHVLATRIFGCATSGRVPFYDLCSLGMHNDIRGYKAGRYRDRLMLTAQVEYRLELPKRFGLAAFFGVGEVASEIGAFNNDNLKPAGGGGIRYTLAKKNHVNLRVDYAVGLQGGGVYMGISEAF